MYKNSQISLSPLYSASSNASTFLFLGKEKLTASEAVQEEAALGCLGGNSALRESLAIISSLRVGQYESRRVRYLPKAE